MNGILCCAPGTRDRKSLKKIQKSTLHSASADDIMESDTSVFVQTSLILYYLIYIFIIQENERQRKWFNKINYGGFKMSDKQILIVKDLGVSISLMERGHNLIAQMMSERYEGLKLYVFHNTASLESDILDYPSSTYYSTD